MFLKGLDILVAGRCNAVVDRVAKGKINHEFSMGRQTMKRGFTIGELAKELHLNPKTIR